MPDIPDEPDLFEFESPADEEDLFEFQEAFAGVAVGRCRLASSPGRLGALGSMGVR